MGTIAEKLTYLDETREKIRLGINSIGGELTSEDTFRSYADSIDGIYNALPKVTGTGSIISLSDTTKGRITSELQGDTSQASTPTPTTPVAVETVTGEQNIQICKKNLFDKSNANILNGFFNGSAIAASNNSRARITYIECSPNTTYTVSKIQSERFGICCTSEIPANGVSVSSYNQANTATNLSTTTSNDAKYLCVFYYLYDTDTLTEQQVLNSIQIEYGNTATTYEAYNETNYELNLGKNLWDENYENLSTGVRYKPIYVGDGTFTMSSNIPQSSSGNSIFFLTGNVSSGASSSTNGVDASVSRTITSTNGYVTIGYRGGGNFLDPTNYKTQLEKSSKPTSYSPYKTPIELCKIGNYKDFIKKGTGKNLFDTSKFIQGTWQDSSTNTRIVGWLKKVHAGEKYTVSLRNSELDFAIGNTTKNEQSGNTQVQSDSGWQSTDYTYTITGDGYLFLQVKKRYGGNLPPSDLSATDFQVELGETASSFEPYGMKDKWYIEKNIGKTVFTGGEGETWSYTSVAQGSLFRNNNVAVSRANIPPISNYFIGVSNTSERYDGTIYYNPSATSTKTTFDIIMNSITTAGDFKSWLSTHNTIVYYPLPTPTYTQITDSELVSQLGSFGEAQSYVGITNINVDGILKANLSVKALENIFN